MERNEEKEKYMGLKVFTYKQQKQQNNNHLSGIF
jgi:hypothetical protein